jgi:hypothetical protein
MKLLKTFAAGLLASILAYTASAQSRDDDPIAHSPAHQGVKKIVQPSATEASLSNAVKAAVTPKDAGQTTSLRIIGAQVFRSPVHQAIIAMLQPGYSIGMTGTSINTAMEAVFSGTTTAALGANPVVIKTTFGTSTSAVRAVATGTAATVFLSGSYFGTNLTDLVTGTGADVCLSGEFQATTIFPTPVLSDTVVGVAPYVWVKNAGSPATLTNMTSGAARSLFTDGLFRLSQLTGSDGDATVPVLLVGRDEGASSREVLLDEIGLGAQQTVINQYQLTISGTAGPSGTVTGVNLYPASTTDGVPYPVGHSGYTTFSGEDAVLATPGSYTAFGGWAVAYSGYADAVTAGVSILNWNGVPYSADAVTNGSYTYWSYSHWMYQSSFTGTAQTVADQIGYEIRTVTATDAGNILISTMNVYRTTDGGTIYDGQPY